MPELPEVETIVRGLRTCLPGRRIARVMVGPAAAAHILQTPPAEFVQALEGASVVAIQRYGKHILLRMAPGERGRFEQTGFWWVVHLGMTGQFVCEPSWHELPRHTHACFELEPIQKIAPNKPADEGRRAQMARQVLRYTDIRQFGRMEIFAPDGNNALPPRLERLGPDPLAISESEFVRRMGQRTGRVKSLLLDQHFLRGLGNIYADECLFRAGVHPAACARRVSARRVAALFCATRSVLEEAIARGGSSVSNYLDALGQTGTFQQFHQVYRRDGQPCRRCGATLRRLLVAGRGSTFCPRCQRR